MCRKNLVLTAALLGLGMGILIGGWIEWCVLRFLLAGGAFFLGFFLGNGNCRHK